MRYLNALISSSALFLMLIIASPSLYAAANDGRTGEDFSDLLFSMRNQLRDFDTAKARGLCGASEALNAVHLLFNTNARLYSGSSQDPAETRTWGDESSTIINIDWTPYSAKSSAGVIMVRARVNADCTGKGPRDLKWASVRYNIPVSKGSDGKFYTSVPKNIHIDTICCRNQRLVRTALFTHTGDIIRAPGTIYPPSTPAPAPPKKPTTGGSAQSASTSQGTTTSTPSPSVPRPEIAPKPKLKPKPWTMENPCPECEDEKAVVEHYKKRITSFTDEKTKQEGELRSTNSKISDLEKDIKALEDRLKGQQGTGAGALDPATGIRTTAYDQGDGTVLVKRIYPDGTEETVDRYTRRSSAEIKRDLAAKKRELERLKNTKSRLEKRIANLDAHIKKTQKLLEDAIAAFKACLEYCNRRLGIASTAATGANMTPGGKVSEEMSAPEVKETTDSSTGMDVEKNVQQAEDSIGSAVDEAVKAVAEAVGALPSELGETEVPSDYKYNNGLEWQLKYKWSSGYTSFNEDGHLDYDFKITPEDSIVEGDGTTPPESRYTFAPSLTETKLGVSLKYNLDDTLENGELKYTYDSDYQLIPPTTLQSNSTGTQESENMPAYSSYIHRAFYMLDDGASAGEVGRYIGRYFHGKGIFIFPGWYMAAIEVMDILDEYDEYDDDIYPDEFGTAVAQAVLAAGGSPHDASVMAARAVSWAGGSSADLRRVRLSTIYNGYPPLRLRVEQYNSWKNLESIPRYIPETNSSSTKFSLKLLQENRPRLYSGQQFQYRFSGIKSDAFLNPYFNENNMIRDPQETAVIPNDPLYQEEDASLVGDLAKKSFGFVMGALGVGVSTNDYAADYQWGLHAIGLTPRGNNSGWDIYDGSEPNVVVAVIDSGSDLNHPDGPAYLWTNSDEIPGNNIDDDNNGYIDDVHGWNFISENNNVQDDFGHGAFVAGIIAAKTNNSIGIAGVNPGARIMTLKASDNNGKSRSLGIYRAIRYAVDNGARVINISLGQQGLSKLEQIGINYAWNMGCLVVVAAGNQAGIVSEYGPPGSPRAFSVASVNVDGKRRGTSNRGRTVAIGAPGEAIYSLSSSTGKHDGQIMPMTNTEYHRLNGTSFAAPYVSGAASLLWGKYPDLNNRQLASLLISTADDINELGWDVRTGAGMLNVRRALETGETPVPGLRITDIRVGREKSKVQWVDLYGVVDGPIESYTIAVAEGSDPDDDEYTEVYGPAATLVDHGLLCRIPANNLEGKKWTFRLSAKLRDGKGKTVTMAFDRDGKILD